jgi:hypothetical protein
MAQAVQCSATYRGVPGSIGAVYVGFLVDKEELKQLFSCHCHHTNVL